MFLRPGPEWAGRPGFKTKHRSRPGVGLSFRLIKKGVRYDAGFAVPV